MANTGAHAVAQVKKTDNGLGMSSQTMNIPECS